MNNKFGYKLQRNRTTIIESTPDICDDCLGIVIANDLNESVNTYENDELKEEADEKEIELPRPVNLSKRN